MAFKMRSILQLFKIVFKFFGFFKIPGFGVFGHFYPL